jgi:hypothetical protein
MPVKSICPIMSIHSEVSLLIICLDDLFIAKRGIVRSSTVVVLEDICGFEFSNVFYIYLHVYTLFVPLPIPPTSPPKPHFQAELVLLSSLILLKRKHKRY